MADKKIVWELLMDSVKLQKERQKIRPFKRGN